VGDTAPIRVVHDSRVSPRGESERRREIDPGESGEHDEDGEPYENRERYTIAAVHGTRKAITAIEHAAPLTATG
jgi:hypothetical protein